MRSIFIGASSNVPTNSSTYVAAVGQNGEDNGGNGYATLATEAKAQHVFPVAGTITRFYVSSSVAPGGSASWAWRIRKNGVDTDAVITLTGAATTGESDIPVEVAAGDLISITLVPTSSPSSAGVRRWTIEFEESSGETPLFFRAAVASATFAGGTFPISGQGASTMAGAQGSIVPCAGTIRSFHARVGTAPTGIQSWLVTLQVNGTPTALAASITAGNTSVISADANIAVAAGDIIRWTIAKVNAPASDTVFSIGAVFVPTVADQQPLMGCSFVNFLSASTTEYAYPGGVSGWSTEANRLGIAFERTIKNFWAKLTVAPGSTHSRAISLRSGGSSVYTIVLTTTDTTSLDGDIEAVDLSTMAVEHDPTGTPANSFLSWAATLYIADAPSPPAAGDSGIPVGYWWPAR
jgi:hypothetical protein